MKTIRLIEGVDYPEPTIELQSDHHMLTCEIASRLQQLDEALPGDGCLPGGVRLINRMSSMARRSPRAYKLFIDMLSHQRSLSLSFESLGAINSTTRQSWLQNAQVDIDIIKEIWPEVGEVMATLIKRRYNDDADSSNS